MKINEADLQLLKPHGHLNSTIIEVYLDTLKEQAKKPILSLNTLFFQHLKRNDLAKAHQAFKQMKYCDVDVILAPLHMATDKPSQSPGHWALLAAFPKRRRIEAFDSLGYSHKNELYAFFQVLAREAKFNNVDFRPEAWHLQDTPGDLPKQCNMDDCGVFTLYFSKCLALDTPVTTFSVRKFRVELLNSLRDRVEASQPLSPFSEGEGIVEDVILSGRGSEKTDDLRSVDKEIEKLVKGFEVKLRKDDSFTSTSLDDLVNAIDQEVELLEATWTQEPASPCLSINIQDEILDSPEESVEMEPTSEVQHQSTDPTAMAPPARPESHAAAQPVGSRRTRRRNGRRVARRTHDGFVSRRNSTQTRRIIFPGGVIKEVPTRFLYPWNGF